MFQLKNYQSNTLQVLINYLKNARFVGAKKAFCDITGKTIYNAINGLEYIPYVCLRLPTGGGKTFLACHSIKASAKNYLEKDFPITLWLTPTAAIKEQTIKTLKNPLHPNRQVLDATFDGNVEIFDIEEFTRLRPQDIKSNACIFVSTLQSFNVKETGIRNIYGDHEALEPHFTNIPQNADLERVEAGRENAGKIKNSFANLLHIHQPLIIVDEAHKAVTGLNREVMQRLNPAAIIEFTATPNESESNILYRVSAMELKAEEMIKLPIILTEHQTWQQSLTATVLMRAKLAQVAANDKDYIRPIALIQAESKGSEVTEDIVKQFLIENENIPAAAIAIATGEQNDLENINILAKDCPIEYVITKQALREGWDCPFAYIFCSVANVQSTTAVEQFLGRVLRMPYAEKRLQTELNKAYAFVSQDGWANGVAKLKDSLVKMGFDEVEIEKYVEPPQQELFGFDNTPQIYSFTSEKLDISKLTAEEQKELDISVIDRKISLKMSVQTPKQLVEKVSALIPAKERQIFEQTISFITARPKTMAEQGLPFTIPQLCLFVDDAWAPFNNREEFMPEGWRLLDYPAVLTEMDFAIRQEGKSFEIDIDGKHITERFLNTSLMEGLDDDESSWNNRDLLLWLDRNVRQSDITQPVKLEFLRRVVDYLTLNRSVGLAALVRTKFLLALAIGSKIDGYREEDYKKGFQQLLFGGKIKAESKMDFSFNFPQEYPIGAKYTGAKRFNKHYYGNVLGDMNGEEAECAFALDSLPEVKCWVRNVELSAHSFSLQTSTDKFYPDFVALLNNGKLLAIEYKGSDRLTNDDTKEKQLIGDYWAKQSQGKCGFAIVSKGIDKPLVEQIRATM